MDFDPEEYLLSEKVTNGNYWETWLSNNIPALVIEGRKSNVSNGAELRQMVERRPNTEFAKLPGRHSVHIDAPDAFANLIQRYLIKILG